jgi:hypothetical protein
MFLFKIFFFSSPQNLRHDDGDVRRAGRCNVGERRRGIAAAKRDIRTVLAIGECHAADRNIEQRRGGRGPGDKEQENDLARKCLKHSIFDFFFLFFFYSNQGLCASHAPQALQPQIANNCYLCKQSINNKKTKMHD